MSGPRRTGHIQVKPIGEAPMPIRSLALVEGQYVSEAFGTGDERLDAPAFPGLTIDLTSLWLRLKPASASR
jgi:hypothetical protein